MSSRSKELAELVSEALRGKKYALDWLYKEVEFIVKTFFEFRYTNQKIVEDLCQDTYLRFLKNFPNLKEPHKFSYFVVKIALHVHQDFLEKKYNSIESSKYIYDSPVSANIDNDSNDLSLENRVIDKIDLQRAMQNLPNRTKHILQMRSEGIRYAEIAKKLNLSLSSVKMIVYRGLKQIKSFYEE